MDRISDFLLVAGFYAAGLANLKIISLLLAATFLISYARARAELASGGRVKFAIGLIERPERIAFLLLVLVLQIFLPGKNLASPLLTVLTILSFYKIGRAHV